MEYVSYPFRQDLNAYIISQKISDVDLLERSAVEMEILALKADVFLKARANEDDFWRVVGQSYCNTKNALSTFIFVLVQPIYASLRFHL